MINHVCVDSALRLHRFDTIALLSQGENLMFARGEGLPHIPDDRAGHNDANIMRTLADKSYILAVEIGPHHVIVTFAPNGDDDYFIDMVSGVIARVVRNESTSV